MKLPCLRNTNELIRSLSEGGRIEPSVIDVGIGPLLPMSVLDGLASDLDAAQATYPNGVVFDQHAAPIIGKALSAVSLGDGAVRGFWEYLALVRFRDISVRRWGKTNVKDVPANRFLGGWKNTWRRLWCRASIVSDGHDFNLAAFGGEDFWVNVIERRIGGCRDLIRTLVKDLFVSRPSEERLEMLEEREVVKWLRQTRPTRCVEAMTNAEQQELIKSAVSAAKLIIAKTA